MTLDYHDLLTKLEVYEKLTAIPIPWMLCYYELIAPIGGMIRNFVQSRKDGVVLNELLLTDLTEKIKNHKDKDKDRCKPCLLKHLLNSKCIFEDSEGKLILESKKKRKRKTKV